MNPLIELLEHGQSYWLDDLGRRMLREGELERRVRDEGLRGVTSNPSIFDKAISGGFYDDEVEELVRQGLGVDEIFERLAVADVQDACDVLRPVYDASDGADGFVSLEVSPYLVHDTEGSIEEACRLHGAVDRPNVLIKLPGSPAGVPAIEECLYRGVNVNVTLLFSIPSYEAVAEAYLRALERRVAEGEEISGVASVASFFLSRIDVLVDELLGQRIPPRETSVDGPRAEELLGRAAIANARLAYQSFREIFSGERWDALEAKGARVQRMLWASTSTKNPLYHDVRYVEPLIGPHTVNTMPENTIRAFGDHGRVEPGTVLQEVEESRRIMERLAAAGIDFEAVTWQLLNEGMRKFVDPYDDLMRTLQVRREEILGAAARDLEPGRADTSAPVRDGLAALVEKRFGSRLHGRDATLWSREPEDAEAIGNRLGWLDAVEDFGRRVEEIESFAREVRDQGIGHVVVLGMGGSSLFPEVASQVFAPLVEEGRPELLVLDSTDPDAVRATEEAIDPSRTLFLVSSKSGTTVETLSFYRHFLERVEAAVEEAPAGSRFVAITDPGTPLGREARERGFRRLFENPEDIGGRYSALSYFGLVPMALMGVDVGRLLERARIQAGSCAGAVPADANPGIHLGAVLGLHALAGRDKVTLSIDETVAPFADWLEQLLAESTGKAGQGLVPVVGEALAEPESYGDDRLFVSLGLTDGGREGALERLEEAGHPVVRVALDDRYDLGAEIFRWEVATATAGAILSVNPFDEPNVAESKEKTRELLETWRQTGSFDEGAPEAEGDGIAVWTPNGGSGDDPGEVVRSLLETAGEGDYVAFLPYWSRTPARRERLQGIREAVRRRRRVATTLGYGPRYLHSSGQLHKGGPDGGVFLILTAGSREEIPIPGEEHDFATLLRAQALGDFRSLAEHGRRVARIDLGDEPERALESLLHELRERVPAGA